MVADIDRICAPGAGGLSPFSRTGMFRYDVWSEPGELMRRYRGVGFFVVGAGLAVLSGTAFAQDFRPSINLNADGRPLTQEEREKRKAVDDAYRSTIDKLPEQKKTADPWGNMRSPSTTSSKQRQ